MLSLISYFGKGEMRERYLGVKIPPTNLKPDFTGQAQGFANRLGDGLGAGHTTPGEISPTSGPDNQVRLPPPRIGGT
ncbi:MAG: hypothetical protein ACRDOD_03905 [Streptosporangiaceae bacterium]